MKHIKFILIAAITMVLFACSKSDINEEPETILSDISGVWSEYAYLCSDGYFVDISDTGYNMYYEFASPNKFTQYTVEDAEKKEIIKQGEWVYNAETNVAHVTEPRGWNLDITFDFGVLNDSYIATMKIKGRTPNQSSTIKVKRISQ